MGRVSSDELAALAARVLNGYNPTREEIESLAGSVLSQSEPDEDKGPSDDEEDDGVDEAERPDEPA